MSNGKTALVTGGSRGIGAAITEQLVRQGFTVAINYHKNDEAAGEIARRVEALGSKPLLIRADVSNADEVAAMFRQLDEKALSLDVLVCNAGIIRDTLLGASEPADFDAIFSVNVHGVANCCREAAKRMIARRSGAIVNLSSAAAQRPGRGQSNYAASKGAVESFTRALAVELAPRGIRVNAVAPGVIDTDMTSTIRSLAPDEVSKRILLRRPGSPQEVAKVVGFLCGDDASYVTGQIWNVDGGFKAE
ncbi:MAG TPA: SDR family NAD(P)-dependent oxidoreductase [Burkholderiales bacterium]|nr:SDR family NAD(P)-dependent oxidoreductase [Burkholderiales bacterium]